jgi:hypothetical protein
MNIADSLVDLLCHVRVPFMLFGRLLVSLSRSLGGAHGAQAGLPHPFAGLLLTHSPALPTHTLADTDNARHNRDKPGSRYTAASRGQIVVLRHRSQGAHLSATGGSPELRG